jgi:hypothetical protein
MDQSFVLVCEIGYDHPIPDRRPCAFGFTDETHLARQHGRTVPEFGGEFVLVGVFEDDSARFEVS